MKKTRLRIRDLRRRIRRRRRQRKEQLLKFDKTNKRGHRREAEKDRRRITHLKSLLARMESRKKRIEASHLEGVDWAYGNISPEALKNAHKAFVCRYLSHDPGKNLTRSEAVTYSQAGIPVVVVWESGSNDAAMGYNQGRSDANAALAQARVAGIPEHRPIFFAVDFDAAGPEIVAYFEGVASVLGRDRAGIYAGLDAVEYILDRKIVHWAWQTYAWSDHKWDARAQLKQVLISLESDKLLIGGVQVDYDKSVALDFGQWTVK